MAESSSCNKRRRNEDDPCSHCAEKKHLYLVLDDWIGGYSIHKLDADNMEEHLPKHAALRVASPERGNPMAFATLGTNIFIVTNPHSSHDRAPPILVYDTANAALAVGPRPPVGYLGDFGQSVGVNGKLYALTTVIDDHRQSSLQLQFCSWGANPDQHEPWDPPMAWTWNTSPAPPSQLIGEHLVTAYALHPDGHTVFVSTDGGHTHFRWTPVMACGETLGHGRCLSKAKPTTTANLMLGLGSITNRTEKLFRLGDVEEYPSGRYLSATLTYMGDSRFCLVENVLRKANLDAVVHVTLFGLEYDHKAQLRAKICRTTRSYAFSKNTMMFSHAAFWL
nr:unnamed protein product [Digitaria exilis]